MLHILPDAAPQWIQGKIQALGSAAVSLFLLIVLTHLVMGYHLLVTRAQSGMS